MLSAIAGAWSEAEQERLNRFFAHWVEMLKESNTDLKTVNEIQKDVDRLKLVSDRFGKIGSKPKLEEKDIVVQVQVMVDYIRKRATGKVHFSIDTRNHSEIIAMISPPLQHRRNGSGPSVHGRCETLHQPARLEKYPRSS